MAKDAGGLSAGRGEKPQAGWALEYLSAGIQLLE